MYTCICKFAGQNNVMYITITRSGRFKYLQVYSNSLNYSLHKLHVYV